MRPCLAATSTVPSHESSCACPALLRSQDGQRARFPSLHALLTRRGALPRQHPRHKTGRAHEQGQERRLDESPRLRRWRGHGTYSSIGVTPTSIYHQGTTCTNRTTPGKLSTVVEHWGGTPKGLPWHGSDRRDNATQQSDRFERHSHHAPQDSAWKHPPPPTPAPWQQKPAEPVAETGHDAACQKHRRARPPSPPSAKIRQCTNTNRPACRFTTSSFVTASSHAGSW